MANTLQPPRESRRTAVLAAHLDRALAALARRLAPADLARVRRAVAEQLAADPVVDVLLGAAGVPPARRAGRPRGLRRKRLP